MLDLNFSSDKLQALIHTIQNEPCVLIEGLWNSPKALVASLAQQITGKHVLIITGASQEEVGLYHDFAVFTDRPVVDFPAWETLPSDNIPPSPDIVGERYEVLSKILRLEEPHIILTSLQACLQRLIPPEHFRDLNLSLKVGDTFPFSQLIDKLTSMGYQRCSVASDKGEFAIRGGIIDVFPVSSPDPFRLEFWGDDLESLRIYDPIGQKSIRQVNQISIPPAQELELLGRSAKLSTIFDYLGSNTLVIFDDLLALEDRYANLVNMIQTASASFSTMEAFLELVDPLQKILWSQTSVEELSEVKTLEKGEGNIYSSKAVTSYAIAFEMFQRSWKAKRFFHPFLRVGDFLQPENIDEEGLTGDEILASLEQPDHRNLDLHVLCSTELEESNFHKKLLDAKITLPKHTSFHFGYLSSGFALSDSQCLILPYTEITRRYKIRRQKLRSTYHTTPSEVYELTPGDTVVHMNNGIGRYQGLESRPNHTGTMSEFFVIEYAENSKLFVPLSQAHLVTKYIGAGEGSPKLHSLGSNRWKKTREQTQKAIMGYASDLLHLYAKRELHGGFSYPEDSEDMLAFEEDFPFVETEDQLNAIANVKKDLISQKAMDRLVCGDVGYGKTEVAMRAAFKAVVDGHKQVAVLVPTTVLAMQHYENFLDRMSNFPINIGVLSRFVSPKQTRATLEGVANGSIDILIGTHRIISGDVQFKDLGLIIIDEEQRFGVKAKEHLKRIKVGVDCLTLSATPIPRTLYLSLIGARDMSVINTPPQDRLPIKTIITEPHDQIIKNAILRELSRDGQAYVIHNRVDTIYDMASRLKKLLPQARIVIGHGQMHADDIDAVFHTFKKGQADILVATTIVENGIDIPNANTILIDRADHFGLADLYQLRGRVGRWNRRAYAYFLVSNLVSMPDLSRQRLNALAETSGYGGGMKVALRDLEIRGAGDILGTDQSGHVSAIGFHLYCKMLKRTIQTLQGKMPVSVYDTKIETTFDARLPEDYVNEVSLRMEIYQRLGESISWEEVDAIWEELKDRFGPPPEPAQWLYRLTRLRVFGALNSITSIKFEKLSVTIEYLKGGETQLKKVLVPQCKTRRILGNQNPHHPRKSPQRLIFYMISSARLTSKYRITIPKEIRRDIYINF